MRRLGKPPMRRKWSTRSVLSRRSNVLVAFEYGIYLLENFSLKRHSASILFGMAGHAGAHLLRSSGIHHNGGDAFSAGSPPIRTSVEASPSRSRSAGTAW
jgi:hypothetical protein